MNFAAARLNMVESQVRPNGITDHRIIDAMALVKRENFLPAERKEIAYLDEDVLLKAAADGPRYLIEPMAFARMVHLAAIKPTDSVLVIGTGTGYSAAIISTLAQNVVALEFDRELAALARANLVDCPNVRVEEGKLAAGSPASGPYDVILIEGRVAEIPESLCAQLNHDGRIIAAVGGRDVSKIMLATCEEGQVSLRRGYDASVAELPGFRVAAPAFVF